MKRKEVVDFMVARFEFYQNKYPGVPLDLIMSYVLKGLEAMGMQLPGGHWDKNPSGGSED